MPANLHGKGIEKKRRKETALGYSSIQIPTYAARLLSEMDRFLVLPAGSRVARTRRDGDEETKAGGGAEKDHVV